MKRHHLIGWSPGSIHPHEETRRFVDHLRQTARTVHLISTPFGGNETKVVQPANAAGGRMAQQIKKEFHNPKAWNPECGAQGSVCLDPNSDLRTLADAYGWSEAEQGS